VARDFYAAQAPPEFLRGELRRGRQLLAHLRNFSHLAKSVWSLGYCRLAFLTLSSSHFDPDANSFPWNDGL